MEMYIALAAIAAILIWAVITYNRFISLRRFKDEAWSGIAVQLKGRHDVAPYLLCLANRYALHVISLVEELGGQREIADRERHYAGMLGRFFAVAEAWPELKASENFIALQQSVSEIEESLQLARRYFNGTVRDFNIMVESFPSLLLARLFNFKAQEFFELDNPAEAKAPQME